MGNNLFRATSVSYWVTTNWKNTGNDDIIVIEILNLKTVPANINSVTFYIDVWLNSIYKNSKNLR